MRRPLLVLAILLLAAAPARSQTITRGPLIQNPDADATKATFVWWTNTSGNSTVEYGLSPGLGSSITVPTAGSCEVGSAGTCHTVTVSGLSPDTTYYYRLLTNGAQVAATTYFTTLATPGIDTDMFFTVIGDWGQGTTPEAQLAALQNAADPPMILTVGDNTYTLGTQSELDGNALAYYTSIFPRTQFFPALGNHDLNVVFGNTSNYGNTPYAKTFVLPRNAPAQPERYYSFNSGQVHFTMIDTDSTDATQTAWLQNDLATSTATWKFVFLHHAPYSCASGSASFGSNMGVRNAWSPLFERYGVDVVFIGHDHIWERSKYVDDYLVSGATGQDGLGTYYIMTGGGGAALDGAAQLSGGVPTRGGNPCSWLATGCPSGPNGYCSVSTYQYTSVRITANVMTLDGIDNAGTVFDTMTINKAGGTTTSTSTSSTTTTSTSTSSTTSTSSSTTSTSTSTSSTTSSTTTTSTSTSSTTSSTTSTSTTSSTSTTASVTTTSTSSTTSSSSSSTSSSTTSTSSTSSSNTSSTSSSTTSSTSTSITTSSSTSTSSTTSSSTSSTTTTSTSTTLPCADVDADGICDSVDPCVNATDALNPRLTVTRLLPPPDDETLKVKGTAVIPAPIVPPLKPHENGVRFLLANGAGSSLIDVTIPPGLKDASGNGWVAHPTAWTWRSTTGLDGVRIVKVKILGSGPGQIGFKVVAKNASLPLTGADLPLSATMVFDPPQALTGRCGDLRFPGPAGVAPACEIDAAVSRVRCK